MEGLSVLDIGGYNGALAAECVLRGASPATVVDSEQWRQYQDYGITERPKGVDFVVQDIMEYALTADIVLAFDVFYHMKSPYLFAEKLAQLTRKMLCLSTRYVEGGDDMWKLFRPREQHHNDPTVFWKPTLGSLHKMLGIVGFTKGQTTYVESPGTYDQDGLTVERWGK